MLLERKSLSRPPQGSKKWKGNGAAMRMQLRDVIESMADSNLKGKGIMPVTPEVGMRSVFATINYLLLTMLDVPFYSNTSRSALNRPEGLPN
jgi:hypothetical protein